MPKRTQQRRETPVVIDDNDDHVSETDNDNDVDNDDEVNENTPTNDENAFILSPYASPFPIRTPLSLFRASQDTALRDITDQFFHPPTPSPVRISKFKVPAPRTTEPPRRPKKPKSLAYPADPPNWLYSRSSSSLPPSSPLPPSTTNFDQTRLTDHSARHSTVARREYLLDTPSKASDSDPFGFIAVERAIKAKHGAPVLAPLKPTSRTSAVKSPPRSTLLPAPTPSPVLASLFHLEEPVATNNEDIEELYTDEPVAGPSHVHVPVAPLLMMNSDQPFVEAVASCSQPTFPDPLRTPRKRKRRVSPTPDDDPDEEETDIPSSPSPVKVSIHRSETARQSHTPILRRTRAQVKAVGTAKPPSPRATRTKRTTASSQNIPTPSSTHRRSSLRHSSTPPTPVPPRRSTRQAVVDARFKLKSVASDREEEGGTRRMLRSRSAKANVENKITPSTGRAKPYPPSKSKAPTRTRKATMTAKPTRGRPKGKSNPKNVKGKGKARPLENVLDLSDDTLERYEKERRERLEYFKRLEGYQIHKENVYVV